MLKDTKRCAVLKRLLSQKAWRKKDWRIYNTPDYVLRDSKIDQVYYLCYERNTEDILGMSNNPEPLDTIIFNMNLFIKLAQGQ